MLRRIGISLLAMAAMLILISPPQASAAVRVGVYVGAPVYTYPAHPYYYVYPNRDDYYFRYSNPAPIYLYPRWREHRRHEYRERRLHKWREHERREHESHRR